MKRIYSFLLVAAILVAATSCSEKLPGGNSDSTKLVKTMNFTIKSGDKVVQDNDINFTYDEHNRLKTAGSWNYEYGNNEVIVSDEGKQIGKYFLDGDKLVKIDMYDMIETYTYPMNSSRPSSIKTSSNLVTTLDWDSNGNLLNASSKSTSGVSMGNSSFTYTSTLDKCNLDISVYLSTVFFVPYADRRIIGSICNNHILKSANISGHQITFTYEFDNDGYVTLLTGNQDNGVVYLISLTY